MAMLIRVRGSGEPRSPFVQPGCEPWQRNINRAFAARIFGQAAIGFLQLLRSLFINRSIRVVAGSQQRRVTGWSRIDSSPHPAWSGDAIVVQSNDARFL